MWEGGEERGKRGGERGEESALGGEEGGVLSVRGFEVARVEVAGRGLEERCVPGDGVDELAEVSAVGDVLESGEAGVGSVEGKLVEELLRADVCEMSG